MIIDPMRRLYDGLISVLKKPGGPKGEENRRLIRVTCNFEVRCVSQSDFEKGQRNAEGVPARIFDLGLSGMRLGLSDRLKQGSSLYVYLAEPSLEGENEHVFSNVRWCRKSAPGAEHPFEAGLQFIDTPGSHRKSWIKFLLKDVGFDEQQVFSRRKQLRAGAEIATEIVSDNGRRYAGTTLNLGVGGALLSLPSSPALDASLEVEMGPAQGFPRLELRARVRKVEQMEESGQFLVGIQFEELKPAQVSLLGDYVLSLLKSSD